MGTSAVGIGHFSKQTDLSIKIVKKRKNETIGFEKYHKNSFICGALFGYQSCGRF